MNKFSIQTIVIFAVMIISVNAGLKPKGGLSDSKPADDEVASLVNRLKAEIIQKICDTNAGNCPSSDAKIVINSYKTQTVSGTNYFVGFTIDDIIYHARIYSQPWTNTEQVHNVQLPKQVTDEIAYF